MSPWIRVGSHASQAIDSNDQNSDHSFLKVVYLLILAFWFCFVWFFLEVVYLLNVAHT